MTRDNDRLRARSSPCPSLPPAKVLHPTPTHHALSGYNDVLTVESGVCRAFGPFAAGPDGERLLKAACAQSQRAARCNRHTPPVACVCGGVWGRVCVVCVCVWCVCVLHRICRRPHTVPVSLPINPHLCRCSSSPLSAVGRNSGFGFWILNSDEDHPLKAALPQVIAATLLRNSPYLPHGLCTPAQKAFCAAAGPVPHNLPAGEGETRPQRPHCLCPLRRRRRPSGHKTT